jgi:tripartite-type tricarboxylate transporter receptor subunit TctC
MRPIFAAVLIAGCSGAVVAQDYPSRTVRLVVPSVPGGGTDIIARFMAAKMSDALRGSVIVENRPGAGSLNGTESVAKALPDGHTILVGGAFNMSLNPALFKKLTYDAIRDFTPVGILSGYPFLVMVKNDLPVATLAEFVQLAKAQPGKLSMASAGLGTGQHVWGTIVFKSLGLDLVHVPYKGAAPAHQDMLAGRIDVIFDNLSAAKPYVLGGRMKGLALSATSRSTHLPNVPTINETGLADFLCESWFALFAPAATPAPIVDRLRNVVGAVVSGPEFAARVESDGGRPLPMAPAEQIKFVRDELERWTALVKRHGVTLD